MTHTPSFPLVTGPNFGLPYLYTNFDMYTRRNYSFWMTLNWSKKPFLLGCLYAALITGIYQITWVDLTLPWQPISVVGIAVAFYLGFKNNSSYDRSWEARKIWGGIVNSSRNFGATVVASIRLPDAEATLELQRQLIGRHLAWLTALRYQLRTTREWEHTEDRINGLYVPNVCEEYFNRMDQEIISFIPESEFAGYRSRANMAVQLLVKQYQSLQELRDRDVIDGFQYLRLQELLGQLMDEQGRCERIKNFPFPRQYASTALWTTLVFSALVPFGLLNIFQEAQHPVFMTIPFSGLIIWIFFLMEMIGDYSENPFEGTYNDVPITAIARTIEIDLREMTGDDRVPQPIQPENGFLM